MCMTLDKVILIPQVDATYYRMHNESSSAKHLQSVGCVLSSVRLLLDAVGRLLPGLLLPGASQQATCDPVEVS